MKQSGLLIDLAQDTIQVSQSGNCLPDALKFRVRCVDIKADRFACKGRGGFTHKSPLVIDTFLSLFQILGMQHHILIALSEPKEGSSPIQRANWLAQAPILKAAEAEAKAKRLGDGDCWLVSRSVEGVAFLSACAHAAKDCGTALRVWFLDGEVQELEFPIVPVK
jgi:hypothetical protein